MRQAVAMLVWIASAPMALAGAQEIDAALQAVAPEVIAWRRDIHAHPELGNREYRTARLVAAHLESLGLEVRTGIAGTGVIGILRGAQPGKVLALRADMDALPVKEATGLPFASQVVADYEGRRVPVMHACGHDAHTAILMGAAQVLTQLRARIAGTVLFVFQPAEEGPPAGEEGGARRMLAEGALDNPRPDAIFALHVEPGVPGRIDVRSGPFLSSATTLRIRLEGRQTHGGRPWEGDDLVNLSADIVKAMNTIAARQVDVFSFANVVTIASVQAGLRANILPGEATLAGTIRTFDQGRLDDLKARIRRTVEGLAAGYAVKATVAFDDVARVTGSDPALLQRILPALEKAAGRAGVNREAPLRGAAEDFSYFEQRFPGVYYIIGSTKNYTSMARAPTNHAPDFDIDESVLAVGVEARVRSTLAYLAP